MRFGQAAAPDSIVLDLASPMWLHRVGLTPVMTALYPALTLYLSGRSILVENVGW